MSETAIGTILVGQQKEAFGLEEMTSSNYITFMERGLTSVFTPSRNTGIQVYNHTENERLAGAFGISRNADGFGTASSKDSWGANLRVGGTPWMESSTKLIHTGMSFTYRKAPDDTLRYRARPSSHWIPRLIGTAAIPAKSAYAINFEGAAVMGPASLQGEFTMNKLDSQEFEDPTFTAFYAYVSYFITGESRKYKGSRGQFSRVVPKSRFDGKKGTKAGAWELAARYGHLDLNDAKAAGGEMNDWTLGVNWYWNSATRIMFNYVRADTKEIGIANSFQTRFQIDF